MRLPRLTKHKIITAIVVILISIATHYISPQNKKNSNNYPISTGSYSQDNVLIKITRVIDGDTVKIETGQTVRYIGIDTPELHHPKKPVQCFGKEAYEKNKELVEGKTVKLEKDVSEKDRYGRLLRYIFLYDPPSTQEALFVNKYLVSEGYAHSATFPPDVKYADVFVTEQRNAVANKKGLWKSCL
ncbi:thermonuclease family protein [Candidatus Roizmanbacteria bacterium]|nr:thermonuclease family protein [Candidatus Roizmanbacteria bacterium]